MLGGALPEVELAQASRGRGRVHGDSRTWSSVATCTWCGRSSAATSTSSRGSCRSSRASTRSARRTSSRRSTRTRSASRPCSARPSPATRTTSSGSTTCSCGSRPNAGLDVPLHVDGASGGFVWPFLYPDSPWDFRLEQVRSINVSGHKFGLVYPGIGWLIFREKADLAEGPGLRGELPRQDRRDVHPELLDRFGDGARAVLQPRPLRPRGLHLHHAERCSRTPRLLADKLEAMGLFEVIGRRRRSSSRWSRSSSRRSAATTSSTSPGSSRPNEAGWCPAYTLPPDAQDVTIMRALVKETMSREHVDTLARDIERGVRDARGQGRGHESERQQDGGRSRPLSPSLVRAWPPAPPSPGLPIQVPADATDVTTDGPRPFVTRVRYVRSDGRRRALAGTGPPQGSTGTPSADLVDGVALRRRDRSASSSARSRRTPTRSVPGADALHLLRRVVVLHHGRLPHLRAGGARGRAPVVRLDAAPPRVLGGLDPAGRHALLQRDHVRRPVRRAGRPGQPDRVATRCAGLGVLPGRLGARLRGGRPPLVVLAARASATGTSRHSTCGARSSSGCRPSAHTSTPSGAISHVQLANGGTFLGAVCFLVASLLMMGEGKPGPSQRMARTTRSATAACSLAKGW